MSISLNDTIPERGAAIVMRQYGGPNVLQFETVSLPSLRPDALRIRTIASPINHSDLEIRAGNWPILQPNPFPYTPGLEVVGNVVEVGTNVSDFRIGERVITMMQGLGGVRPQRPGGYAEYVAVRASAVAAVSADIDPLDIAALGLGSVTAFEALRKIGDLGGRRVAVTGAAGGVGSAAVAIARAQGAEVIGIISRSEQTEYVRSLGASTVVGSESVAAGALGSESIDGILDTVAGKTFASYVAALRPGGVPRQLRTWRAQYPEFRIALDAGNEVFDTRVERALAERAIGFYETWEEDKINPVTGQGETFIHREYYPPDTKAANQWLTNRKRHEWKNVQNTEVEVKRRSSDEILAGIYERLAKLKEQGYLTTIELPALPAPQDDSDVED